MSTITKPYINYSNQKYDNRQPNFYGKIEEEDLIKTLEENCSVFLKELTTYLEHQKQQKKFFILYNEEGWNTIMLHSYGLRYHKNCNHFKETLQLLKPYKNILTIYFSTLEPHVKITPHYGDTDATYRIHLGLKIPDNLPACGIEVGGVKKAWIQNGTIIFNDAHYHVAWNLTNEDRTVLIVDVLKPCYEKQKWYIVPGILGALGMSRIFFFLRRYKIPKFITKPLHLLATIAFMIILPIQKSLRIFYK